jgi:hypothetical protein
VLKTTVGLVLSIVYDVLPVAAVLALPATSVALIETVAVPSQLAGTVQLYVQIRLLVSVISVAETSHTPPAEVVIVI